MIREALVGLPSVLNPREYLVSIQQLDIDDIFYILDQAERFSSDHSNNRPLMGKRCVLYFAQSSTRTYTSFSFAAQTLGMYVSDVREPGLTAVAKGERVNDVLRTLARNSDIFVVRDASALRAHELANMMIKDRLPCRIISAGCGSVEHPTQALCDLFVTNRYFPLAENLSRKVVFVGDVRRGRTALSFSRILANWRKWEQFFLFPGDLAVEAIFRDYLRTRGVDTHVLRAFDEIPHDIDLIYMMRNQKEYGESAITDAQYSEMTLSHERIERFRNSPIILHPLPRGEEIPEEFDDLPNAKYWEVVQNGQNVRQALFMWMFGITLV